MQHTVLFTGPTRLSDTQLIARFKEKYGPSLFVISEVSHELLPSQPEHLQYADLLNALFSEQVRRETEAMKSGSQHIICDHGTLDILAYATLFQVPHKQEWVEWTKYSYNCIFWLDCTHAFLHDAHVKQPHRPLDSIIAQTLQRLGLSWQKLTGDVETQMRVIDRAFATT